MKNDKKNRKGMKQQGNYPKTKDDGSLKKQWQTPEIIEEDARKTEASGHPYGGSDLGMYS